MGALILVGGGVRSGKSAFALRRAAAEGPRRAFVATAEALDAGMAARIARHRADRDPTFSTVEAPRELASALCSAEADVVVVDCLTLWLSNLLGDGQPEDAILASVDGVTAAIRAARFTTIVVTNEVGLSVHPESELGRRFQDLAGRAHQRLAAAADEIYLAALGTVLRIKPGPVSAMNEGGEP